MRANLHVFLSISVVLFACCSCDHTAFAGSDDLTGYSEDPAVVLPSLDTELLYLEDRSDIGFGLPRRIGINRDLPPIDFLAGSMDFSADADLIWRISLTSTDAFRLRILFENVSLEPGDVLRIYGKNHTGIHEYRNKGPHANSRFWSWATTGDSTTVEWIHPMHDDAVPTTLPFEISAVSHAYLEYPGFNSKEGACHNDATCDPDYRPQRDGSAYIEFNAGGWYICCGTMLNNTLQDFTPYFMTANHCISDQETAETVQVYFYYFTQECNSGTASKGTAKNGSDLLAASAAGDFSLLQLYPSDFESVFFCGWDRNYVSENEAVTCIHHPDGSYRRISYGHRTTEPNNLWRVLWDRTANPGSTESGSSGGGLFRDGNHLFIGQLFAGTASCDNPTATVAFGRFSSACTIGNLPQWLGEAQWIDGAYFQSQPSTPTPSPTPLIQPTATPPECTTFGCSIWMPSQVYQPADPCACSVSVCNDSSSTKNGLPVFVILALHDSYFFAPDFSAYNFYQLPLPPGTTTIDVLTGFSWPTGAGEFYGAVWYAAVTDSEVTQILGQFDTFEFSWHE